MQFSSLHIMMYGNCRLHPKVINYLLYAPTSKGPIKINFKLLEIINLFFFVTIPGVFWKFLHTNVELELGTQIPDISTYLYQNQFRIS